jgi:hypothetical protein
MRDRLLRTVLLIAGLLGNGLLGNGLLGNGLLGNGLLGNGLLGNGLLGNGLLGNGLLGTGLVRKRRNSSRPIGRPIEATLRRWQRDGGRGHVGYGPAVHGRLDLVLGPERLHVAVGRRGVRARDVDAVGVVVLHGRSSP